MFVHRLAPRQAPQYASFDSWHAGSGRHPHACNRPMHLPGPRHRRRFRQLLLADASSAARTDARAAFGMFKTHWPKRAEGMLEVIAAPQHVQWQIQT